MTITVIINKGILNYKTYNELYDKLRVIQYETRFKVQSQTFEVGKEYIFEGKSGTVVVTFEQSDMV